MYKRQTTSTSNHYQPKIEDDNLDIRERVKEKDTSSKEKSIFEEIVQKDNITYKKEEHKDTVY